MAYVVIPIDFFEKACSDLKSAKSDYLNDWATDYLTFLSQNMMFDRGAVILSDTLLKALQQRITAIDLLKFKRAALPVILHTASPAAAMQAYREILPLMDSVKELLLDQSLTDSKAEYRIQEQDRKRKALEQQNLVLAQENQIRRGQFLIVIIAIVALLFLVLYLVLRHRNKSLLQQRELERTRQEVTLQEQRLELETQLRNMREKVIQKQKTDLLHQVEEIDKLKSELEKAADSNQKNAEDAFYRQLLENKNKIGLEQFLQQFNSIYPRFFSGLSKAYPLLTTSDLQFCALVRLNLSIKDISNILGIEPKSTYTKKYRIEEKMAIEKSTSLEQVLFAMHD